MSIAVVDQPLTQRVHFPANKDTQSFPITSPHDAQPFIDVDPFASRKVIHVLMISSDPSTDQRLRLQAEERAIRKLLQNTGGSKVQIELEVLPACTVDDLASKLLTADHGYDIVHFSGHCDSINHIYQYLLQEIERKHGLATLRSLEQSEHGMKIVQDIASSAAKQMDNFTVDISLHDMTPHYRIHTEKESPMDLPCESLPIRSRSTSYSHAFVPPVVEAYPNIIEPPCQKRRIPVRATAQRKHYCETYSRNMRKTSRSMSPPRRKHKEATTTRKQQRNTEKQSKPLKYDLLDLTRNHDNKNKTAATKRNMFKRVNKDYMNSCHNKDSLFEVMVTAGEETLNKIKMAAKVEYEDFFYVDDHAITKDVSCSACDSPTESLRIHHRCSFSLELVELKRKLKKKWNIAFCTPKKKQNDFPIIRAHSVEFHLPPIKHQDHCPHKNLTRSELPCVEEGKFGCCNLTFGEADHPLSDHMVVTKRELINAGVGSLAFETEHGNDIHFVSAKDFAQLLSAHSPPIRCVLLNACNSHLPAEQLLSYGIPFAICTKGRITDSGALKFSQGFYESLAFGNAIERSYAEGLLRLQLHEGTQIRTSKTQEMITTSASEYGGEYITPPTSPTSNRDGTRKNGQPESHFDFEQGRVCLLKAGRRRTATSPANIHIVEAENLRMKAMIQQGFSLLSEKDREIQKLQHELQEMKKQASKKESTTPKYSSRLKPNRRKISKPWKPAGVSSNSINKKRESIEKSKRSKVSPKDQVGKENKDVGHKVNPEIGIPRVTKAFGSSVPRFAGFDTKEPARYDKTRTSPRKATRSTNPFF